MNNKIIAVTISHQIGSGGAYIGEKLADRLGIPFLDRKILQNVARQLDLMEEEVEHREERLSTFWESFSRTMVWADPVLSMQMPVATPSDSELFDVECSTLREIAEKRSAVFLGRCGWHILQDHPNHVAILLTADPPARVRRLCELYRITEAEAHKLMQTNDREREEYNKVFTKKNWLDARYYDLCVSTSAVGWDRTVDLAESCIQAKLG